MFPLIQLPRKSEDGTAVFFPCGSGEFPLIQLPRKSEVAATQKAEAERKRFH